MDQRCWQSKLSWGKRRKKKSNQSVVARARVGRRWSALELIGDGRRPAGGDGPVEVADHRRVWDGKGVIRNRKGRSVG